MNRVLIALLLTSTVWAEEPVDLILVGGKIVTVDSSFRVDSAMAVRDGKVVRTGTDEQIMQLPHDSALVVQLDGKMVLPGLIDSHTHPTGASRFEADHEVPSMETIQDVLDYVKARTKVVPKGEWINLSQVFITRLREQRFPTRKELDSVAPDHPVSFRTGPDGSANSLALNANGIDREFAAKHADNVMVDDSGEPNGILRKASAVLKVRGSSSKKLSEPEQDDRLTALFRDYNSVGITATIDRNCNDSAHKQYVRMLDACRLSVRIRMSRGLSPRQDLKTIEARLDAFAEDDLFTDPKPRLGIIGVKCFLDGGMLTGSAFFRQPWGISRIYGIEDPAYRGMQYIETERVEELVRACAQRGLAFTAHCQGDAAVEALIGVYEKVNESVPISPTRSSVTHSSFMSRKAIDGAARLGIGVDLQPAWLYLDARTLLAQFGEERLNYFIPLKSLMAAGVKAGGGSDHMQKIGSYRSVNPYNPFLGMWIAATRSARWYDEPVHLEQALSRKQMIQFYTINNAWLMRMEKEIGSLEPGKRADFVIIDRDLLTCSDENIRDTKVISTWMDGQKLTLTK